LLVNQNMDYKDIMKMTHEELHDIYEKEFKKR
jgi:lysozyme family protein